MQPSHPSESESLNARHAVPSAKKENVVPELREFLRENDGRLHDFCAYLLYGVADVRETTVLLLCDLWRDFGDSFRRRAHRRRQNVSASELRAELFRSAWRRARDLVSVQERAVSPGRDTRASRGAERDVLEEWRTHRECVTEGRDVCDLILDRLAWLDLDFRAPVVLRDILGFGDEDVMSILELRWGVYRHRLHRGRLELCAALRGTLGESLGGAGRRDS